MTYELSQSFLFNADATRVVNFIMGDNDWQANGNLRTVEIRDGQAILRLWLSAMPGISALYGIGIVGGTRMGAEFYDEKSSSLLSASTDLGEIALRQTKAGECMADFYLESNPRCLGSDHTSLWGVTPRLLGIFWNELIISWLKESAATTDTQPRPSGGGHWPDGPSKATDNTARHSREPSMTLGTLMAVWPDVPSDRLEDRLVIWELWDKQRMMLKQIVSQVNPSESTIKRHLGALEEAGLLKRKRRKMNSK